MLVGINVYFVIINCCRDSDTDNSESGFNMNSITKKRRSGARVVIPASKFRLSTTTTSPAGNYILIIFPPVSVVALMTNDLLTFGLRPML